MGGEDDGHTGVAQRSHIVPHALAQLDVDAGGRLVEKQDGRFVRQSLGDQDPALHAARQRHELRVLSVPQGEALQHALDIGGVLPFAPQSAAERDRRPHRLEHVGGQLLRHEPDQRPYGPVIGDDVVTVDGDLAGTWGHDPANDVDQRGLAGAVRPEQSEDLAFLDVEIDILERLEARGVGLRHVLDGDDRWRHGIRLVVRERPRQGGRRGAEACAPERWPENVSCPILRASASGFRRPRRSAHRRRRRDLAPRRECACPWECALRPRLSPRRG